MIDDLRLIEGVIEHLEIGQGRVNLLKGLAGTDVQGAGAALQALAGNIGQAAAGSMVAMYDGEDMDYFVCYVGEHLVQGVFPHVTFQNGDYMKVVYIQEGNELHAKAMLCPEKKMLWMPLMLGWGIGKTFLTSTKLFFWLMVASIFCIALFCLVKKEVLETPIPLIGLVGSFILFLFIAIWDFKDFRRNGQLSTAIFELLGFKNPFWLDLRPFSLLRLNHDFNGECVYRYDLAENRPKK